MNFSKNRKPHLALLVFALAASLSFLWLKKGPFSEAASHDSRYDSPPAAASEGITPSSEGARAEGAAPARVSPERFVEELRAEAMAVLQAEGLAWPSRSFEESDSILSHNLSVREIEALSLVPRDPHRAVAIMEESITYEEEKFVTRFWQKELRSAVEANGGKIPPSFWSDMVKALPDRHFLTVLREQRTRLWGEQALVEAAIDASYTRSEESKHQALAILLDHGMVTESEPVRRAFDTLTEFLGRPAAEEEKLVLAVQEMIDQRERERY